MTDLNLSTQEVFDQLEDIDETWALKLLDECEQEIHANSINSQQIDDQEIRVEQSDSSSGIFQTTTSIKESTEAPSNSVDTSPHTTAIERQIKLRAEQAKSEPSNVEQVAQGFWSFLKKSKAVN